MKYTRDNLVMDAKELLDEDDFPFGLIIDMGREKKMLGISLKNYIREYVHAIFMAGGAPVSDKHYETKDIDKFVNDKIMEYERAGGDNSDQHTYFYMEPWFSKFSVK